MNKKILITTVIMLVSNAYAVTEVRYTNGRISIYENGKEIERTISNGDSAIIVFNEKEIKKLNKARKERESEEANVAEAQRRTAWWNKLTKEQKEEVITNNTIEAAKQGRMALYCGGGWILICFIIYLICLIPPNKRYRVIPSRTIPNNKSKVIPSRGSFTVCPFCKEQFFKPFNLDSKLEYECPYCGIEIVFKI